VIVRTGYAFKTIQSLSELQPRSSADVIGLITDLS